MKKLFILAIGLLLNHAIAQDKSSSNNDPVAQSLFSPELILQYQEEIGLSDKQRAKEADALVTRALKRVEQ